MTNPKEIEKEIDELVRDYCMVGTKFKSQIRKRLERLYVVAHEAGYEKGREKGYEEGERAEREYADIQFKEVCRRLDCLLEKFNC